MSTSGDNAAASSDGWQLQSRLEQRFICPLSGEIMEDPVIAADGVTYQREAIEGWFSERGGSDGCWIPVSNVNITAFALQSNEDLRRECRECLMKITQGVLPYIEWSSLYHPNAQEIKLSNLTSRGPLQHVTWKGRDVCLQSLGVSISAVNNANLSEWKRVGCHPSIIMALGITSDNESQAYLVHEEAKQGSLRELLLRNGSINLSTAAKIGILLQVCEAMQMLATSGLTHCSLSSESVFVDALGNADDDDLQTVRVRVRGLGLQHDMDNEELIELARKMPEWMAPEMLKSGRCSEKSDVWAFGVLVWELYSGGARPYAELDGSCELLEEHVCVAQQRLPRPENCPEELFELLERCWQKAARKRPTFCELHKQLIRIFPVIQDTALDRSSRSQPVQDSLQSHNRSGLYPISSDIVVDVLAAATYNNNLTDHISMCRLTDRSFLVTFGTWGDVSRGAASVGVLSSDNSELTFSEPCFYTDKVPHPIPSFATKVSNQHVVLLQDRGVMQMARVANTDSSSGKSPGIIFGDPVKQPSETASSYWNMRMWKPSDGLVAVLHSCKKMPAISLARYSESSLKIEDWNGPFASHGLHDDMVSWIKGEVLSDSQIFLLYGCGLGNAIMGVVGTIDMDGRTVIYGPPAPFAPERGPDVQIVPGSFLCEIAVLSESLVMVAYSHGDEAAGKAVVGAIDPETGAIDFHGWTAFQPHGVWELAATSIPGTSSCMIAFSDSPQARPDQWQSIAGPGTILLSHYMPSTRQLTFNGKMVYEPSRVWKSRMLALSQDTLVVATRNYSRRQNGEAVVLRLK